MLVVEDGRVLVDGAALVLIDADKAPEGERFFLGVDDDTPYFAVVGKLADVPGARRADLRQIGHRLNRMDAALVITAISLVNWHARHGYSPLSGGRTKPAEAGWTRVSQDGAETHWPRTDPAAIVLIHDGRPGPRGRCLLAHNATWTAPGSENRYSCLAGYVEPGESAEMTAAREVYEEVGLVIRDIRYVASQPWPFPGSLMLGFTAVADPSAELNPDPEEISHARWFTREEIGAALDQRPVGFGIPSGVSIAHFLIARWHAA